MSTTTEHTTESTIEQYLQFWSAATEVDQRAIAAEVFADDVEYHALPGIFHGVDQLIGFRAEFTEHVGPVSYRGRGAADHHHDRARVPWEIVLADGTSFATGTDILDLTDDGRIAAVSAFVDQPPEGFDQHAEH
ncbi:nuclear transport factor 2 family protein [Microlunatus soli]|uniref:SnoaL-like domain-containing protein n=1 Tax=Microlunatus soli TaxID=630515 RepID=A0A1H1Y1E9_9ACTN|nr:nuclear transport factor 2 family protein [Microlunatus soli]SDT15215.1 SnoaL-like domain-containing protein [Microlunatus soli]